jgi:hypothetical protein
MMKRKLTSQRDWGLYMMCGLLGGGLVGLVAALGNTRYPFSCDSARVPGIKYTAKLQQIGGHEIKNLMI